MSHTHKFVIPYQYSPARERVEVFDNLMPEMAIGVTTGEVWKLSKLMCPCGEVKAVVVGLQDPTHSKKPTSSRKGTK